MVIKIDFVIENALDKTTVTQRCAPSRTAGSQTVTNRNAEGCGATGLLRLAGGGAKRHTATLREGLVTDYRTKHARMAWSAAVRLGTHPKGLAACPHETRTRTLQAAVFITTQAGPQPRGPLAGDGGNRCWSIQMMRYCSALMRNELSVLEKTGRKRT